MATLAILRLVRLFVASSWFHNFAAFEISRDPGCQCLRDVRETTRCQFQSRWYLERAVSNGKSQAYYTIGNVLLEWPAMAVTRALCCCENFIIDITPSHTTSI